MNKKSYETIVLVIMIVLAFGNISFANIDHMVIYEIDGNIISGSSGGIGKQTYIKVTQTIANTGPVIMNKSTDIDSELVWYDISNKWDTVEDAFHNLIDTSSIQLCEPPKYFNEQGEDITNLIDPRDFYTVDYNSKRFIDDCSLWHVINGQEVIEEDSASNISNAVNRRIEVYVDKVEHSSWNDLF